MVRLQYRTNELNFRDQLFFSPVNPFAPGNFAKKRVLKLVVCFFWSSSCKKLKRTTKRFTGRTLVGVLIQVQNTGHAQETNFRSRVKKKTTTQGS